MKKNRLKKILTKIFTRKHKKEEKNIIEDDEEKQKKNDKEKEIELDKISEEGSNLIKQGDKFLISDEELLSKIRI